MIKMSKYAIMVTITWNHVASLLPLPLYLPLQMPIKPSSK